MSEEQRLNISYIHCEGNPAFGKSRKSLSQSSSASLPIQVKADCGPVTCKKYICNAFNKHFILAGDLFDKHQALRQIRTGWRNHLSFQFILACIFNSRHVRHYNSQQALQTCFCTRVLCAELPHHLLHMAYFYPSGMSSDWLISQRGQGEAEACDSGASYHRHIYIDSALSAESYIDVAAILDVAKWSERRRCLIHVLLGSVPTGLSNRVNLWRHYLYITTNSVYCACYNHSGSPTHVSHTQPAHMNYVTACLNIVASDWLILTSLCISLYITYLDISPSNRYLSWWQEHSPNIHQTYQQNSKVLSLALIL